MKGTDEGTGPPTAWHRAHCILEKERRKAVQPLQSKNQPPAFPPHQPDLTPSITSFSLLGEGDGMEEDTADCTSVHMFLTIELMQRMCLPSTSSQRPSPGTLQLSFPHRPTKNIKELFFSEAGKRSRSRIQRSLQALLRSLLPTLQRAISTSFFRLDSVS